MYHARGLTALNRRQSCPQLRDYFVTPSEEQLRRATAVWTNVTAYTLEPE